MRYAIGVTPRRAVQEGGWQWVEHQHYGYVPRAAAEVHAVGRAQQMRKADAMEQAMTHISAQAKPRPWT